MKPSTLCFGVLGLAAAVSAVALGGATWKVRLPVHSEPVTFFSEEKQGITLAGLPSGIRSLSAEACASCHKQEHADWKQSAHARSVTEPVFAAAFKAEPRFVCRACHSPLIEQQPKLVFRRTKSPKVLVHGQMDPRLHELGGRPGPLTLGAAAITESNPHFDRSCRTRASPV